MTKLEQDNRPIFIVGASRSGTTLLRQMLNNHNRVWITGETHYFDDLRPRVRQNGTSGLDPAEVKRCLDYFARLKRSKDSALDPAVLEQEANARGGDADAHFEAFCRLQAQKRGKELWGEKTPRHAFRIGEMLDVFPQARIISLVRDPRAVVASYRDFGNRAQLETHLDAPERATVVEDLKRVKKSYNIVLASLLWNAAVRAAYDARSRFGLQRVYIQRYEALIATPEEALRQLTNWLGLDYQDGMLEVRVVASSYGEVDRREGILSEPVHRWRRTLTPTEASIIQTCCGRMMAELGYEKEPVGAPLHSLLWAWLTLPAGVTRALLANRGRMGKAAQYGRKRLVAVARRTPLVRSGDPKFGVDAPKVSPGAAER